MAIVRMISRDPSEFRQFQADMVTLGKIRTGVYATPAGKRGRPEKLDRFRFTSPDRDLIDAVAAEYGGDVRPWSPEKDPKRKEFEVITDTDELHVLIVNGQKIDPTYEAWAAGRTCVRRCDGEWDVISQAPCLCTGPNKPSNPQDLCKITTRVKVMLQRVIGVGSWMYESHGENFATETGGLMAELVARATVPVPSLLRLELETRRERNHEKKVFETKSFYVARFRTTAATPQQALTGGDTLTQALTGAPVRAIEAPQARAGVEATPVELSPPPAAPDVEKIRPMILADIELQESVEGLDAIRNKLKTKGINDQKVIDAWQSKMAAVQAAAGIAAVRRANEAAIASGVEATRAANLRDEAAKLAADPTDRAALNEARAGLGMEPLSTALDGPREYAVGDTVTVGGIEFTKIRETPNIEDMLFEAQQEEALNPDPGGPCLNPYCVGTAEPCGFTPQRHMEVHGVGAIIEADRVAGLIPGEPVEGTVEAAPGRVALPDVPEGDYDADELYTMLMTGASHQAPPLTTSELNRLITRTYGVDRVNQVGGYELARLRAGLKSGAVNWR